MKVFYFNDEKHTISVFIGGLGDNLVGELKPAEGRVFDVPVPDRAILWVKKWHNYVMLSWADEGAFEESL